MNNTSPSRPDNTTPYQYKIGERALRRKPNGEWTDFVVNHTYLSLTQNFPEDYQPLPHFDFVTTLVGMFLNHAQEERAFCQELEMAGVEKYYRWVSTSNLKKELGLPNGYFHRSLASWVERGDVLKKQERKGGVILYAAAVVPGYKLHPSHPDYLLLDAEEDSPCPELDCDGTFERESDGDCACHINPPCSACENAYFICNRCGLLIPK